MNHLKYDMPMSIKSAKACLWIGTAMFSAIGMYLLAGKGYVSMEASAPNPTIPEADIQGFLPRALTDQISEVLRFAEPEGLNRPIEHRKWIVFVVGTKACAASLSEAHDYATMLRDSGEDSFQPVMVVLSNDEGDAGWFVEASAMEMPTVMSSEKSVLEAFGISDTRPSRQLVLVVNPHHDAEVEHSYLLVNTVTSFVTKRLALGLDA